MSKEDSDVSWFVSFPFHFIFSRANLFLGPATYLYAMLHKIIDKLLPYRLDILFFFLHHICIARS